MSILSILIADDDEDDKFLLKSAFEESGIEAPLSFVDNGQELVDFLHKAKKLPSIILLDLNMPKKDGREALKEIKENPKFRSIPILILTTSNSPEDIKNCYFLGANCFITKPSTFEGLMKMIGELNKFWFNIASIPTKH
ncbi:MULTISPECIES: response regulator [Emticicia]|uniref:response regulator n=1 Tax=Emticicia TaxID=312278 RepID=UPI000C780071|nr:MULTISPECIES: response regulator [Emticicia]PLK42203.1 two-component system response regulator [Emticicia sp. TH156]UTA68322.1 response regulator [Emticicia sp. 21SJ11W-3]